MTKTTNGIPYIPTVKTDDNKKILDADLPAAWVECDSCDEFICNVHPGEHAFECSCPVIDVWAEHDLFPYTTPVSDELIDWVKRHPFQDE